jgi:pimeloyl-ACP methyl ester carboxylesterase
MGGFITLSFVVNHPDRLLSAAVCGAGWMLPGGPNDVTEDLAKSLESGNGITPLMDALTPPGKPKMPKAQMDAMNAAIMATNDPIALASVIRAMGELTPTLEQLRANKVPVIGIVGEIDPLREAAGNMTGALDGLRRVCIIPGADHITAIANPELYQDLHQFIGEHTMAHVTD